MINFHKYGFLDAKKLLKYVENGNYWICRYNPIWLFIWSDKYKPEIAFDNDYCYIRFLMPEIGMCYYPPLGNPDISKGIKNIKKDAFENGFDLNMAPIEERLCDELIDLNFDVKPNDSFSSYIYTCDELAFFNKNKKKKKSMKKYEKLNPTAYYRPIKKEDFPQILEFIENWHLSNKLIDGYNYYAKLNSIKKLIDHLYEFDLTGIMLVVDDKICGLAIGSIYGNMAYLHLNICLNDPIGSNDILLSSFAKIAILKARYINLEEDLNIEELKKELLEYNPTKLEKFYSTFRL